jgi:hypothetical protein
MWDATLKSLNPNQNQICIQNHHVWGDFEIQVSNHHMLWKVEDYHFTTKSSKNPSVGHCEGSHIMPKPFGHDLCYESISWSIAII